MKKIKETIIHLLGGYTSDEHKRKIEMAKLEEWRDGNARGCEYMATDILSKMQSLYGLPADDWCSQMYDYVKKKSE